jgi:uncharacterized protein (DUF1330 family)
VPAYLIVDIDIQDPGQYEQYKAQVPALIRKHGGKYLVRGGPFEVIEGAWQPTRLVLFEFPDRAAVQAFHDDPDYAPLRRLRQSSARTSLVVVEGLATPLG